MTALRSIRTLAASYGAATELSPRQVSWRVFGDTNILDRLERGGDLTTRRFETAIVWFSENWPDDIEWPSSIIPRPVHHATPSPLREENGGAAATCHANPTPADLQERAR